MKIGRKQRAVNGFNKGRKTRPRFGPIMVDDVLAKAPPMDKDKVTVRSFTVRNVPADPESVTTTIRYEPLDQPRNVLHVLQHLQLIEKAIKGNALTTGPTQYAMWRNTLEGTALAQFDKLANAQGNETVENLSEVKKKFVKFFLPKKVLSEHQKYMRHYIKKPYSSSTRRFASAVETVNNYSTAMPPNFNEAQKIPEDELKEIIAAKLPYAQREILASQRLDPRTTDLEELIETAERAETEFVVEDSSESEGDEHRTRSRSSRQSTEQAQEYFCKHHGPNSSHSTKDCKVINDPRNGYTEKRDKKKHRKRDRDEKGYKDYKAKYQKKRQEFHMLEQELKKNKKEVEAAKAKWEAFYKKNKADLDDYRKLKALREATSSDSDSEESSSKRKSKKKAPTYSSSSSGSSSSSDFSSDSDN